MNVAIYSNIGNKKGQDSEDQLAQLRSHQLRSQVLDRHRAVYLFVDRDAGKTSARRVPKAIRGGRAPRHPVRGLVSPVQFIPLAEETGLIVPIGLWVLRGHARRCTGGPPSSPPFRLWRSA